MGNVDPVPNVSYDIDTYAPMSGRILGEGGRVYNLVDLLMNFGGGTDGDGNNDNACNHGFFKSVPTYAELPQPAVNYKNSLYFVQESTGGLLAFVGSYKYPRGFYAVNTDNEWELVPINVSVSENAFSVVNINDWAAFREHTEAAHEKDIVLYDGIFYQNLTGAFTDDPPSDDTDNWIVFSIPYAEDSARLGGKLPSEYAEADSIGEVLAALGTAMANIENKLDGGMLPQIQRVMLGASGYSNIRYTEKPITIILDRPAPADCYIQPWRYSKRSGGRGRSKAAFRPCDLHQLQFMFHDGNAIQKFRVPEGARSVQIPSPSYLYRPSFVRSMGSGYKPGSLYNQYPSRHRANKVLYGFSTAVYCGGPEGNFYRRGNPSPHVVTIMNWAVGGSGNVRHFIARVHQSGL